MGLTVAVQGGADDLAQRVDVRNIRDIREAGFRQINERSKGGDAYAGTPEERSSLQKLSPRPGAEPMTQPWSLMSRAMVCAPASDPRLIIPDSAVHRKAS